MCKGALPHPSREVLRRFAIVASAGERSEVRVGLCGLEEVSEESVSWRRSGLLRRQASRMSSRGVAP